MHDVMMQAGIVLALCAAAGCAEFSGRPSIPASHGLPQAALIGEPADSGFLWRDEAQELRTFADHHDMEAEMLLQRRSPSDARLIQQRRVLARQLRVAAAQMEQGMEEVESRVESGQMQ